MTDPIDIVSARSFARDDYFRSGTNTILHDGDVVILDGSGIFRIKVVSDDTSCYACDLYVGGECTNTYYRCNSSTENPVVAMAKKINHD